MLIIIVALVLVLIMVGGGLFAFFYITSLNANKEDAPPKTFAYSTGDFIATNCKDSRRLIKAVTVLNVIDDGKKTKDTQFLTDNNATIRDIIINILRSKTVDEYNTEGIEDQVKLEIIEGIKQELSFDKVYSVSFSEFVMP